MINQVLPANIADKKAFKDFAQPKNGYYINTPVAEQETRNLEEEQKKKDKYVVNEMTEEEYFSSISNRR